MSLFLEILLDRNIWRAVFDFQSKLLQPIPKTNILKANNFYLSEPYLVKRGKALKMERKLGIAFVCNWKEERERPWLMPLSLEPYIGLRVAGKKREESCGVGGGRYSCTWRLGDWTGMPCREERIVMKRNQPKLHGSWMFVSRWPFPGLQPSPGWSHMSSASVRTLSWLTHTFIT